MNPVVLLRYLLLLLALIQIVCSANWAQLAGIRSQNIATPYVPDQWSRSPATSIRPMWSARWGHAVVVLNQAVPRKYLTAEQNSERAKDSKPILVLLGGDDGLPWDTGNTSFSEYNHCPCTCDSAQAIHVSHNSFSTWKTTQWYLDWSSRTFSIFVAGWWKVFHRG